MGMSTLWWLIGLILVLTLVFRRVPALDMETSTLFYEDGFWIAADDFWRGVRRASINLTKLLVPLLLVLWVVRLIRPESNERLSFTRLAFPTLSLLLGPLLVTNGIFKEQWGRPRPACDGRIWGGSNFCAALGPIRSVRAQLLFCIWGDILSNLASLSDPAFAPCLAPARALGCRRLYVIHLGSPHCLWRAFSLRCGVFLSSSTCWSSGSSGGFSSSATLRFHRSIGPMRRGAKACSEPWADQ